MLSILFPISINSEASFLVIEIYQGGRDMGIDAGGSGERRVFKAFGALVLIIIIWLLLIGILGSSERRGDTAATVPSPGNPRHLRREKHSSSWDPDLIYESKRRVPNGPDPIHNRHIGENRRPSGRV